MTDSSRRIGDYEVLAVLGSGGMGKVFKVRNVISDRIEAMKILLPDLAGRQDLADRFLREIKVLASLDHPNIAQLRTALTISNQLVMVMEYVEGTTLAERLEQGPIPAEEAARYINQILSALSYAHGRNVIHRDIKPSNMMLTPSGTVKLMDFGIARNAGDAGMTTTGTTVGSLYYMSPEQVKGGAVDARSDLYSLGVSFYEMVTGERPFKADSDYSLMTAQLQERPKPPSVLRPGLPVELNGIILHSMAKDPEGRFQTADEFSQALASIRGGMPSVAVPLQPPAVASSPMATGAFTGSPQMPSPTLQAPAAASTQPEVLPSVADYSVKPSRGRGLYMTLGAVIVLVVLVLAGISFPRWLKTRASEQKKTTDQMSTEQNASQSAAGTSTNSASTDPNASSSPNGGASGSGMASGAASSSSNPSDASGQPPADNGTPGSAGTTAAGAGNAGTADGGNTAAGSSPGSAMSSDNSTVAGGAVSSSGMPGVTSKTKHNKKVKSNAETGGGTSTAGQDMSVSQGSQASVDSGAAQKMEPMEEVEQDVDQASSRANAASESLDNMRRQLSSQGLSLRGDIASSQELMKSNLEKAQRALQNQDVKSAKRYLNVAQGELAKIEKFLGH